MVENLKRTDFLFPRRSFWTGFSSILNIFGDPYKFNSSKTPEEADLKAIKSDWEMVGEDFFNSIPKFQLEEVE
jgi:hypothetical protein